MTPRAMERTLAATRLPSTSACARLPQQLQAACARVPQPLQARVPQTLSCRVPVEPNTVDDGSELEGPPKATTSVAQLP